MAHYIEPLLHVTERISEPFFMASKQMNDANRAIWGMILWCRWWSMNIQFWDNNGEITTHVVSTVKSKNIA